MTCKDCIHEKVCNDRLEQMGAAILLDVEIPKCGCKIGDGFQNKADFVEVVRCKDCKYYDNCGSNRYCNYFREVVGSYHFCGYGERKENNEV